METNMTDENNGGQAVRRYARKGYMPPKKPQSRKGIFTEHASLRSVQMEVQHRHLRTALMQMHTISPTAEDAFNARLKHILELGLIPDKRPDGRGWRTYGLVDMLEISLCLQLQRAFIPPATAVRFVTNHRDEIDILWKAAADRLEAYLTLEVDAFSAIGTPGREKGRGSRGNETGTIRITQASASSTTPLQSTTLIINLGDMLAQILSKLGQSVIGDIEGRMKKVKDDLARGIND
jgi:hypothetical protein